MDSDSLYYSLDLVAGSGHTLNLEKKTALQTSLVILKKNYKFNRVLFWGKILGLKDDYFVAQGRGEDEMKDRKYLYSFNCMDWYLLPSVTDSMTEEVSIAAKGRFIGDPSYVYEHVETHREGDGDEDGKEEEVVIKVNEERRLAVTVHQIDKEVSVVPRGAFIRTPHGLVQMNRSFGGLSHSETLKLNNFLHFTEPKNLKKKSILEMADLNPVIDFMDVLSDDIPKGSWSLQFECASKVCVIRSLLWLGLTFYHVPMTPQHGYIYIGDGTKNLDLPFML
ncbi:radial spoke head protein 9 homolog [Sphaeramia orbicularis]|uniref:Radial spoke head protein 9 homolog n=1 Tax=Sphaeramia orbicularis TaxID=375764 RepID=A0A673C7X9_9TELE|nr:radial spoke head protein 9 homolog [Sphaeramia orbicularis]